MALDNLIIFCPKRPTSIVSVLYAMKPTIRRLAKSRTLYYANTVVILCLILSGDIPSNKHQSLVHLQHATKQFVVAVKNLLHRLS